MISKYLISLIVLVLSYTSVHAQYDTTDIPDTDYDSISVVLPPLQELLDSAYSFAPTLRARNLEVEKKKIQIDRTKKAWQKYLTFNNSYTYGNNISNVDGSIGSLYSSEAVSSYGTGVSFSISLYTLTTRKKSIEWSVLDMEQAQAEADDFKLLLTQIISRLYQEVQYYSSVLSLRNDAVHVAKANLDYAELCFKNNSIDIAEYTKLHELYVKARISYETAKSKYIVTLQELSQKSGFPLK